MLGLPVDASLHRGHGDRRLPWGHASWGKPEFERCDWDSKGVKRMGPFAVLKGLQDKFDPENPKELFFTGKGVIIHTAR